MRTTIFDIQKMKRRQDIIPVITAYDYTSAQIADRAGIPMIHVGDTLGMVVLGYQNTLAVTLDEMVYHTRIVVRGAQQALVTADMPFLTYTTVEQAVMSAGRLMQEAGAQAVKLEGGEAVVPMVRRLVELGIPVVGHLGYTPQSEHQIGAAVCRARMPALLRSLSKMRWHWRRRERSRWYWNWCQSSLPAR